MSDQLIMQPIRFGAFMIHRDGGRAGGRRAPRRHDTFAAAEREAERLLDADPDATFVITREEARVCRRQEACQ